MITLIVGHRGVGKSSLLKRLLEYHKDSLVFDLDTYIEEHESSSIADIFASRGESYFRKKESEYLFQLTKNLANKSQPSYIALGAGYQGEIPAGCSVLFLTRSTDIKGRSFLNRPRLNSQVKPLDEYLSLFEERQSRYQKMASDVYLQSEGFNFSNEVEKQILTNSISELGGALTVLPENLKSAEAAAIFFKKHLSWGLQYFEVRDDLLSPEQISTCLKSISAKNLIFSYRDSKLVARAPILDHSIQVDWPLELGEPATQLKFNILSLHERKGKSVFEAIDLLENQARAHSASSTHGKKLKLAIEIFDFKELMLAHKWAIEKPNRIFLPRSPNGRWAWYRLLMKNKFTINFIRESGGSSLDQPTLADWLRYDTSYNSFAAILGQPVEHSYTCAEQFNYFKSKSMNVLRIDLSQEDWQAGALESLKDLGLTHAAVTSPLKLLAFEACEKKTPMAEKMKSVNTLFLSQKGWSGHNTDIAGFKSLVANLSSTARVPVWGGGGTLPVISECLPESVLYSARTGLSRVKKSSVESPEILIWASSSREHIPPKDWKIKELIDLNYSDSSPGLEYCVQNKIKYNSGMPMFIEQAREQRKFWDECK